MDTIFVIVVVVILPALIALRFGKPKDRVWLSRATIVAAFVFLVMLRIVNDKHEYAGGGDDLSYYRYATGSISSSFYEQLGYPNLLRIVSSFVNDNLFSFKALNITFLLLTAMCWYRIGVLVNGSKTGKIFYVAILLAAPLWYYFFFLLKDMAIMFLFSLFSLGLFKFYLSNKGIILMLLSSVILGLFRLPLVALNIGLIAVVVFLVGGRKKVFKYIASTFIISILIYLGTNFNFLAFTGINPGRNISMSNLSIQIEAYNMRAETPSIFKTMILYILTETSAFNKIGFQDASTIRGTLSLPWIFIAVPLFFSGCYYFIRYWKNIDERIKKIIYIIMIIIIGYFIISIMVRDTTRWRIPALPHMVAIAAIGWQYLGKKRIIYLYSSGIVFGLIFALKYFV